MKSFSDILKFGFKYIKKHRYNYLLYIILSLLTSLISIYIPLITGQIVDLITGTDTMFTFLVLGGSLWKLLKRKICLFI